MKVFLLAAAFSIVSVNSLSSQDMTYPNGELSNLIQIKDYAGIGRFLSMHPSTPLTWSMDDHPLLAAIKKGEFDLIKVLLASGIAQSVYEGIYDDTYSLLRFPIDQNDPQMVEFLLSNGYRLGNEIEEGLSINEISFALDDRKADIIDILIKHGADPAWVLRSSSPRTSSGGQTTLLIMAAKTAQLAVERQLLQRNVNANELDINYYHPQWYFVQRKTALDIALEHNDSKSADLLKSYGAKTAMDILWSYRQEDLAGMPSDYFGQSCCTAQTLQIRDEPRLSGKILGTLMNGESVTILNTSEVAELIDGIKAYWYFVLAQGEKRGWCFGGYLEDQAVTH